jgi:hypothetical protein
MKGQKNEILTRPKSRHISRPDVFYFFATAHFLKQLPTRNGTFAFASTHKANPSAKSKEPFFCDRINISYLEKINFVIR